MFGPEAQSATPYFGVAFYLVKEAVKVSELMAKLEITMGPTHKQVASPKKGYIWMAHETISSFDGEGDPMNVCAAPVPTNGLPPSRVATTARHMPSIYC